MRSVDERFDEKVLRAEPDACWLWLAGTNGKYGKFFLSKRGGPVNTAAHVFAYIRAFGPVPRGKEIHHRCEEPLCVNPGHLYATTRAAHNRLHHSRPTCKRGHPKPPGTVCRPCRNERQRRYYREAKAA